MLKSMTGFATKETRIQPLGRVGVELKSSNHKFFEVVFRLPEGLLALEHRIKKEIEAKIKRGRVVCAINIMAGSTEDVFINKPLLKNYLLTLKNIKRQFHLKEEASLDTLINLPGILALSEKKIPGERIWPRLKLLVNQTLDDLVKMRQKEGSALYNYSKSRSNALGVNLEGIKKRFKKVIAVRLLNIKTDEERSSFLKDTDITEEIERLDFHIRNFKHKLSKNGAIGKELDFITQEMQREANTIGAKSFDVVVSSRTIQIKSLVEKIREQLQNIE